MREIRFRAWDKENKEMFNVSEIDFGNWVYSDNDLEIGKRFENVELMQYTGLKDKNGKEIYEGDLIKSKNGLFEMSSMEWGWTLTPIGDSDLESDFQMEVIGNIYENPELAMGVSKEDSVSKKDVTENGALGRD